MTLDRPDLSSAFKPGPKDAPDRAASLGGLLAPRVASPATTVPKVASTAVDKRLAPAPSKPAPTPASRPAVVPVSSSASTGAVSNVGVYIEPDVLPLVKAAARDRDLAYHELLAELFDLVDNDELAREFAPAAPVTGGRNMPARSRRRTGVPGIQIQLRLDDAQREFLDRKVQSMGAPSRSALVAAVFKLGLVRST